MTAGRSAVLECVAGVRPEVTVTNSELAARLGIDEEWIRTRTGIGSRRHAPAGTGTTELAVQAGRRALDGARSDSVDAVVLATSTADRPLPAAAPEVAHRLGLGEVAAFDVAAVCSGFVYALATAAGLIAARSARRVLVIAAERYSSIVDPYDRDTAVIFADGAGACVLRAGEPDEAGALGPVVLGSDGSLSELIQVPAPEAHFRMRGRETFRHAVRRMADAARSATASAGWALSDLDRIAAHQANDRILKAMSYELGLPDGRMLTNIGHSGNTGASSIPLLLADAVADGTLTAGHKVLMAAFGGGLTWGATTLIWPTTPQGATS